MFQVIGEGSSNNSNDNEKDESNVNNSKERGDNKVKSGFGPSSKRVVV